MGYLEEIKEARRKQNDLNRRRSRSMETRVMRRLNGHRVPMSGSGALKGDGIVQSPVGMYLVECKYSAQTRDLDGGSIRFRYEWVPKLAREVEAMRAKFGIFVVHFHNHTRDYVLMQDSYYLNQLRMPDDLDSRYTYDDKKSGYVFTVRGAARGLELSRPYCVQSEFIKTRLVVMDLADFEDIIAAIEVAQAAPIQAEPAPGEDVYA